MALHYFSRKMADLAVLEVGLGGRLDSTNVVDPLISIITNIAKDHEEVLGRSLLKIAEEKAGIIKKGRPLITAATQPQVLRLISRICRKQKAPHFRVGKEFRYARTGERDFHYEGLQRKLWGIHLNLYGPHQIINATTALGTVEVLEDLGYTVSTKAMIEGLSDVNWPGRLEILSSSPRVVVDGAHNPAGAQVLRESLEKEFRYRRLILLVGIMKDKDFETMLHTLAPMADHVILSRPNTVRAASPVSLKKSLGRNGKGVEVIENLEEAIGRGISMAEKEDLVCITGSLYTVGEAKAYFLSRGKI
jgi:dihydrofolate synthase/folylpolyglutamate synthase